MGNINTVERMRRMGIENPLAIINSKTHICSICGIDKPSECFYPEKRNITGLRKECKECFIKERNTKENREKSKIRNREARKKDLRVYMCYAAKCRAKKVGVPFTITKESVHIPERCPVLGTLLKVGVGQMTNDSPSLDRMIPELGYVPGNISVISYRANRIKNVASINEIAKIINYVKTFGKESINKEVTCSENQQVKIHTQTTEVQ